MGGEPRSQRDPFLFKFAPVWGETHTALTENSLNPVIQDTSGKFGNQRKWTEAPGCEKFKWALNGSDAGLCRWIWLKRHSNLPLQKFDSHGYSGLIILVSDQRTEKLKCDHLLVTLYCEKFFFIEWFSSKYNTRKVWFLFAWPLLKQINNGLKGFDFRLVPQAR